MYVIAVISIIVLGVAFAATGWLIRPGSRLWIMDHPNERSLHASPVPRSGGLAIALAIALGAGLAAVLTDVSAVMGWIGLGAALVVVISFADDCWTLHVHQRLPVHLAAAGVLILGGLSLGRVDLPGWSLALPLWLGVIVSMLFIVWMVNLYNFMDGMDGFAGGMGVIGFGCFAWMGGAAGGTEFALVSLVVASASAGFLIWNYPPARIFMGDSGSSLLGFLAAALALWAQRDNLFPLWVAVLVFSPFVVDATVTLIRRILRGERFWLPHRSHYYQRLVRLGWGHGRTVRAEYFLMLTCGAAAELARHLSPGEQRAMLLAWIAIYVLLMLSVRRMEVHAEGMGE